MSDSCTVKLRDTYHLICGGRTIPLQAFCGVDLYVDGPVTLLVGALYKAKVCETCAVKEKEAEEASFAAYASGVKDTPNKDLLEEVYGLVGALHSDNCTAGEYADDERKLKIAKAELDTRLTDCGFLS
jgi:hypothetical protein